MNSRGRAKKSLLLYPKIYYFIPAIRAHERVIDSKAFIFDEPMDAILWFIEILTTSGRGFCPRPILKNLIRRWYGEEADTNFDRCYRELFDGGFITFQHWPKDNRVHDVQLTDKGQLLLEQIKERRYSDIALLRETIRRLPRKDRKIVLRVFDDVAERAWTKMLEDEDPENFYQLYEKTDKQSNTRIKSSSGRRRR